MESFQLTCNASWIYLDVLGVELAGVELGGLLLLKPNVVHLVGVEERSKAAEPRLD